MPRKRGAKGAKLSMTSRKAAKKQVKAIPRQSKAHKATTKTALHKPAARPLAEPARAWPFPRFQPTTYFVLHLLFAGLSYVLLRQYVRFIIFWTFIIALGWFQMPAYAFLTFLLVSAFDAYVIALRLRTGEIFKPARNPILTMMCVFFLMLVYSMWIISVLIQNGFLS